MPACASLHKHSSLSRICSHLSLLSPAWSASVYLGCVIWLNTIIVPTYMYHDANCSYYAYFWIIFSWKTTVLVYLPWQGSFHVYFHVGLLPNIREIQKQASSGLLYQESCTTPEHSWTGRSYSILLFQDLQIPKGHGLQFQVAENVLLTNCICP